MNHHATAEFRACHRALPAPVRAPAHENFELLKADPRHPSLHFERIGPVWSARVGLHHRAPAAQDGEDLLWFWIGTHAGYDRLVGAREHPADAANRSSGLAAPPACTFSTWV